MPLSRAFPTSAGSSLPSIIAFATTVPLDGLRYMPRQSVSGALAFTAGTVKPGGFCTVSLISNGANSPTFVGMVEDSSSQGWLSTANAVNNVTFWADDTTVYYAIRQAATPQFAYPPATAYTLTGPSAATIGTASSAFTVSSNGSLASAVTVTPNDGGAGGTFTPSSATLASGNATSATFTYTPSSVGAKTISTTNNGGLTNPSSVILTAASAGNPIRLTSVTGLTETVDGAGYDYTPTTSGSYTSGYGVSSVAIPANSDGYFGATNKALTVSGLIMGIGATATNGVFSATVDYGIYSETSSGANWQVITAKAGQGAPDVALACQAGDIARIRRSGTTIYAEVARAGSSTYTVVKTWTATSTAAMYAHVQQQNTSNAIVLPFGSANVA